MLKITVENVVWSRVEKRDAPKLYDCLSYMYKRHIYNPHARQRSIYKDETEYFITSDGLFLTGFIPRVKKYLDNKNIEYDVIDRSEKLLPTNLPELKTINLRDDQLRLVNNLTSNQRGVIVAGTGSGKTAIAAAIISCYKKKRTLFMCHTRSLVTQAMGDFKQYGLKNITMVSDGKEDYSGDIVVATWQSVIKSLDKISDVFDLTFVDEVHKISDKDVKYSEILQQMLSPIRVGLTATFPSVQKSQFAIEGVIGEVVGELTPEEAKEKKIVVDTKVVIRKTVLDQDVRELSRYPEVYRSGIVNNRNFNTQVIREAKSWVDKGESVLVFFVEIDQGKLLKEIADELGFDCELIYGATDSNGREIVKRDLKAKKLKCVLASKIWNEGISIPQLSVVINAAGGKSDIMVRQLHGRGTRLCEGKDILTFVDFFNPSHNFFISHFGQRFSNYCDWGWV